MNTSLINTESYEELKISSLPTNPTADVNYGGYGYSASQMKAAFDALPLFIIERLNTLISDISAEAGESITGALKTGISEGHTVENFFDDIMNGAAAGYFAIGNQSLAEVLTEIKNEIRGLQARL